MSDARLIRATAALGLALCACHHLHDPPTAPSACDLSAPAVGLPGHRVLALVVGISDYGDRQINLDGARADAEAIAALLTDPAGFAIPPANVCLLVDRDATKDKVRQAFQRTLTDRAVTGDQVLFYFAGHGSSAYDLDGDEADGWDGTLVLADSRAKGGEGDWLDDDLAKDLAALQQKTTDIALLLDACSSETMARGGVHGRSLPPAVAAPNAKGSASASPLQLLPGIAVLAAAKDQTLALEPEGGGHGFFTAGLLEALKKAQTVPATWAQVFQVADARVQAQASAQGQVQTPAMQGAGDHLALRPGVQLGAPACVDPDPSLAENQSLEIKVVPADGGAPFKTCGADLTVLPLCAKWRVDVVNHARVALTVKAALLHSDGAVTALPGSDLAQSLLPDAAMNLDADQIFQAAPPVHVTERVIVVGDLKAQPPRLSSASVAQSACFSTRSAARIVVSADPAAYACDADKQADNSLELKACSP